MCVMLAVNFYMYFIFNFKIETPFNLSVIWTVYIFNSIMTVAYIVIYIFFLIHSKNILKEANRSSNRESKIIKLKAVQDARLSILIYFIAMIQFNIIRMINSAVKENENIVVRAITMLLLYISEIIMLIFLSYQLQKLL